MTMYGLNGSAKSVKELASYVTQVFIDKIIC